MRFGVVVLPQFRWAEAQGLWRRLEAVGFDHGWTYDHLAWRSMRDEPWYTAVPFLAGAATATERLRLGTLVASPNFRHPVTFAKDVMALDDLSGGRMIAGVGAGGLGWDAVMLGQPELSPRARADRFEEFVSVLDALMRAGRLDHRGEHYVADGARALPPGPQQPRPELAVAGNGPRGMRLAARLADTWITSGDCPGEDLDAKDGAARVAGQLARLHDVCEVEGRDPATLSVLVMTGPGLAPCWSSAEELRDAAGRYAEVGVTDLVTHWPRPAEPFAGHEAAVEAVFAEVLSA